MKTAIVLGRLVTALGFGLALAAFVEQVLDPQWRDRATIAAIGVAIGIAFWVFLSVDDALDLLAERKEQSPRVLVQPRSITFDKRGADFYLASSSLWVIASVPQTTPGRVTLTMPSGYFVSSIDKGAGGTSWEEANASTFEAHISDSGLIDLGRIQLRTDVEPSLRRDVIRLQFIPNDSSAHPSSEERIVVGIDI